MTRKKKKRVPTRIVVYSSQTRAWTKTKSAISVYPLIRYSSYPLNDATVKINLLKLLSNLV